MLQVICLSVSGWHLGLGTQTLTGYILPLVGNKMSFHRWLGWLTMGTGGRDLGGLLPASVFPILTSPSPHTDLNSLWPNSSLWRRRTCPSRHREHRAQLVGGRLDHLLTWGNRVEWGDISTTDTALWEEEHRDKSAVVDLLRKLSHLILSFLNI